MIRHCDGTDPNLTRELPEHEFDPATMTRSPWDATALPAMVIIACQCGLQFDDTDRRVTWPHHPVHAAGWIRPPR